MTNPSQSPANPSKSQILNFKLLAQHELDGFGGVGEGINLQIAPDGRRILWLAHESAPKNFTAVDVSDPRKPKVVMQTELPHKDVRSNSLDVVGNTLVRCLSDQDNRHAAGGYRSLRHLGAGKAQADFALRPFGTAFTRRARSVVRRWRVRAHGVRRRRFSAARPQGRSMLHDRGRAQSVQAGRSGPLVGAGNARRRQRTVAAPHRGRLCDRRFGFSRAQYQCLSGTPEPRLRRISRLRCGDPRYQRQSASEDGVALEQLSAELGIQPYRVAAVQP